MPATSCAHSGDSPRTVAQRLGVSAQTVIDWIRSGELPALDIRRPGTTRPRFRIREQDIAEFTRRRQFVPQGR